LSVVTAPTDVRLFASAPLGAEENSPGRKSWVEEIQEDVVVLSFLYLLLSPFRDDRTDGPPIE
jgi:hypothetical protein